ncbi:MAG: DUF72 domain-containing protein [Candidatus Caldatribacteriaceae bacterium]
MFHVGTCSWTDRTLIEESNFYPRNMKTAEERLRFYAQHFDTVEVDSTFYAFPSERNALLWAERTPPHFLFNVKAFSLFTFHRTAPEAVPPFLQRDLNESLRGKEYLRTPDLPPSWLREALLSFFFALHPLKEAKKIGYILFQFPPWFRPETHNLSYLEWLKENTGDFTIALEFRHRSWVMPQTLPHTLKLLKDLRCSLVCVDEPDLPWTIPPFFEWTSNVAVVRFHGRNREAWQAKNVPVVEKFRYLYNTDELQEWRDRIFAKLSKEGDVFLMFNNCYRDFAVRNALEMKTLLQGEGRHA